MKNLINQTCKNCAGKLNVYSICFDCHQVTQKICYKCQWETDIVGHPNCHRDIAISFSKPAYQKHSWQSALDRLSLQGNEFLLKSMQKIATFT